MGTKKYILPSFRVGLAALTLALAACQESFDERCVREAREYTEKHCPMPQGDGCTLDSAAFNVATRTLSFHYTLTDSLDGPDIHRQLAENHDALRREMLSALRNSIALKEYMEHGLNFSYVYTSRRTGRHVIVLTFTPSDYQRP